MISKLGWITNAREIQRREWKTSMKPVKVGTGRKITSGEDIVILTIGHPGNFAQEAVAELNPAHTQPG